MTFKQDLDLLHFNLPLPSGAPDVNVAFARIGDAIAEVEALDTIEKWLQTHHACVGVYAPAIHGPYCGFMLTCLHKTEVLKNFLGTTRLEALAAAAAWCEANP